MPRIFAFGLLGLVCSAQLVFAKADREFLPQGTQYNSQITSPSQALSAEVGEWHVRHDQLVDYMRTLAAQSERVSLIETGRTHENRPLLLLAITSPANQQNLTQIQQRHLSQLGNKPAASDPLILWMGYSVHGDESSGSNAALLVAYYLAAGQNDQIDQLLENNVVLLDPSINPDGLARFAQWANMHKGKVAVSDPNNREHQQAWPSGRTNHYWFDLNRDWLLLTHPESRARVKQFQQWRPHVLTDFHEMGSNSTFFFQPGVPARKNPWTPLRNVELTAELAKFHAAALDDNKQLYFSEEGYDDFYFGKGSTYPDAHGSIGILFEQASSRGHVMATRYGDLSFSQTIQNQVTTSLSTFAGALAKKQDILQYQQEFKQQTAQLIAKDELLGYVIQEKLDQTKLQRFLGILQAHHIRYQKLSKDLTVEDQRFDGASSVFVPLDQPQYRLIRSLFSTRQSFDDNTFYDVSNWNLALAFNLSYRAVMKKVWSKIAVDTQNFSTKQALKLDLLDHAYAYAFSWDDSSAATLLSRLLQAKVKVQIAGEALVIETPQGGISLPAGSVIVPSALQQPAQLKDILLRQSVDLSLTLWSINTGLTKQGIDIGSRGMQVISMPKVLLVGGNGTSQYEVGEAWHHLDQQLEMPVTIVDLSRLDTLKLETYSHMIWVDGNYKNVSSDTKEKLEVWLKKGGVLIGQQRAIKWFADNTWLKAQFKSASDVSASFEIKGLQYADKESFEARQQIAGAVFATQLDLTHPLAFGFQRAELPLFRNNSQIMLSPEQPFVTVAKYSGSPLMAGYTANELQSLIAKSAAIVAHNVGEGKVIAFNTNLNFRGVWQGSSRLFDNAIFMTDFIDASM
jgi:hypothetical protein